MAGVGTLNEKSLHAQLKQWYARPGDRFEVPVGRHIVDVLRGNLLIEIQTANLSGMRRKLPILLEDRTVRVVLPVAQSKMLVKIDAAGAIVDERRSPKRGSVYDAFSELVSVAELMSHPRFGVHVLLTAEREVRAHDPDGNWRRRGWRTVERSLIDVVDDHRLDGRDDVVALLPDLPERWTTSDLARLAGIRRRVAQQVAYTLRKSEAVDAVGKQGNAIVYSLR